MEALLRIVSLGGAARQAAKIKTRQPLAELVVSPGNDAEKRAVERFHDLIVDELNVKAVSLHDPASGTLLTAAARLNKKTAAAKLGPRLKDAETALAGLRAADLAARLDAGPVELAGVALERADFVIEFAAEPGWAGVADKKTQVAVATAISEDLKFEGLSRDVIRQVQEARKAAGLDMLDKIVLHLGTDSGELANALEAHCAAIATATQAVEWSATPPDGDAHTATVKIDGRPLTIALRKA